jgi:photosystem II stability/assembly factor-like uncharacterized protein
MKKFLTILPFIVACTLASVVFFQGSGFKIKVKIPKEQRIQEAVEQRRRLTKDPVTGEVPTERMQAAFELVRRKVAEFQYRGGASIAGARWKERGPYDVGGRTRALLIDKRDPTRRAAFSGGVSGGIWRTEDITSPSAEWRIINDFHANNTVTDIVQNPNNTDLLFYCTGELAGGVTRGGGIFRSTDGGNTWTQLPATVNSNFWYTQRMAINPATNAVFAATDNGVYRSLDNGDTWSRVLGSGVSNANEPTFYDLEVTPSNDIYAASSSEIYRSSSNGDQNTWANLTSGNGFPNGISRVEMDVCESAPNVLYAVTANGGDGEGIYRSENSGQSWIRKDPPQAIGMGNFTRGQAGYDLDIAVSSVDPNRVFVGGIDLHGSDNGGSTWTQITQWASIGLQYMHADQHRIILDESNPDVMYFTNDGGIFRTNNARAALSFIRVNARNARYNTTQFYACDIHPDAFKDYFLAGAQDNGSQQFDNYGIDVTREVLGGDGFYCFIDQEDPSVQFVSLYYGSFAMSTDGGLSFGAGFSSNGGFLCPAAYDSDNKIAYAQSFTAPFYRYYVNNIPASGEVTVTGANMGYVTHMSVDPNDSRRLYIGMESGRLVRIDDATTGNSVVGTQLQLPNAGTISCVSVENGNPDHLLVTMFNWGLTNNIWESFDGGQTWRGCEGVGIPNNFPDVPVNWCLFNPNYPDQAIVATDIGVWSTDNLDGNNTVWDAPNFLNGSPLVPTNMLRYRTSDKVVLAGTYGRGLFTSDVFSDPTPYPIFDRCHYTNSPMAFNGERSLKANSHEWSFGDGATSNQENASHSYSSIGAYNVNLSINNDPNLSAGGTVKILPDRATPYKIGTPGYGGNFEGQLQDFGVQNVRGTPLQYGRSTIPFKDGTHSGDYAWVLGATSQTYEKYTENRLYTPNYDFSTPGIYEISFWAKYQLQPGRDGFRVEYSLDRGQTWAGLGSEQDENWYNFRATDPTAWPVGTSYITGTVFDWTQYRRNVSEFSGQPNVAFRIVFKSEGTGAYAGLVLDDWEVEQFTEILETRITSFTGEFRANYQVRVNWATYPEYRCDKFEIWRSENGRDWELKGTQNAPSPGSSLQLHEYEHTDIQSANDLYYYRIKVIGFDTTTNFWSDILTLRRGLDGEKVYKVAPNPFDDYVDIMFNFPLDDRKITIELYDVQGHLLSDQIVEAELTTYLRFNIKRDLPRGVYILRVQIQGGETYTTKLWH